MATKFDYDLNIFQREYETEDGGWDYAEPWFIHIYECVPGMHHELGEPIELTAEESNNLINNDSYFSNEVDTWYGLEGFYQDKQAFLSERLKGIFDRLPKYREEVLF